MSDDGKDLIKRLLTLDPKKRISSTEALEHPWMQDEDVVEKARKIMEAAAKNVAMPPPPHLPVRCYLLFFFLYAPWLELFWGYDFSLATVCR